jgi:hypothetical protein
LQKVAVAVVAEEAVLVAQALQLVQVLEQVCL